MILYSIKVIYFIRFPSQASCELHNDTRIEYGMAVLISLRCFGMGEVGLLGEYGGEGVALGVAS